MDLRIIKTKKSIREAFLELRKKYSIDEIKVTMLCEKAIVNKTTFYNHYQDIYELSEELEEECLQNFFQNFQDIDLLLTNPDHFINGLNHALETVIDSLPILFRGKIDVLTQEIEHHIQSHYGKDEQMLVSFFIGGTMHLILQLKNNSKDVEKFLIDIINKTR